MLIHTNQLRSTCILCGRKRDRSEMIGVADHWFCKPPSSSYYWRYTKCNLKKGTVIDKITADYSNAVMIMQKILSERKDIADIKDVLPIGRGLEIPGNVRTNGQADPVVRSGRTLPAGSVKRGGRSAGDRRNVKGRGRSGPAKKVKSKLK